MVKMIDINEFKSYIDLYWQYLEERNILDKYTAFKKFIKYIDDMYHFGLYDVDKNNKLIGFITGKSITKDIFYFEDIFVQLSYRYRVRYFVNEVEEKIKNLGFNFWLAQSTTTEGDKLLKKLCSNNTHKLIKENGGI